MTDIPLPRMRSSRPLLAIIVLFVLVFTFSLGIFVGRQQGNRPALAGANRVVNQQASASAMESDVNFAQFWEVWNILKDRFYQQPVSEKSLYYGAVKGLVAGTEDPYTLFMDPKEAKKFSEDLEGSFGGIGAEIGIKDNQLQVISPLPNTPASRAGLEKGDAILAIDKVSAHGLVVEEAVRKIRGDAGTQVVLTIRRGKAPPNDVSMKREKIVVESVKWKMENGVALVNISIFGPDTTQLFNKAVNELLAQGAKGIVLDLRGNPGGLLTSAIDVASVWVGYQPIVLEKGPHISESFKGVAAPRLADVPTIVLVDEGSASASEIVAGALQDYHLATLVGTKTFGKGSVQDLISLSDGAAIKVTIAAWHTPKDRSIHGTGITPDTVVSFTAKDIHDKRDAQKEKALEIIRAKLAGK